MSPPIYSPQVTKAFKLLGLPDDERLTLDGLKEAFKRRVLTIHPDKDVDRTHAEEAHESGLCTDAKNWLQELMRDGFLPCSLCKAILHSAEYNDHLEEHGRGACWVAGCQGLLLLGAMDDHLLRNHQYEPCVAGCEHSQPPGAMDDHLRMYHGYEACVAGCQGSLPPGAKDEHLITNHGWSLCGCDEVVDPDDLEAHKGCPTVDAEAESQRQPAEVDAEAVGSSEPSPGRKRRRNSENDDRDGECKRYREGTPTPVPDSLGDSTLSLEELRQYLPSLRAKEEKLSNLLRKAVDCAKQTDFALEDAIRSLGFKKERLRLANEKLHNLQSKMEEAKGRHVLSNTLLDDDKYAGLPDLASFATTQIKKLEMDMRNCRQSIDEENQAIRMANKEIEKASANVASVTLSCSEAKERVKTAEKEHRDVFIMRGICQWTEATIDDNLESWDKEITDSITRGRSRSPHSICRTQEYPGFDDEWHLPGHLVYSRVRIDDGDIKYLKPGAPLNDNIINFYLKYMRNTKAAGADSFYICDTLFYTTLRPPEDSGMIRYDAVKKWTRKVDIFAYDYVIVPVHEANHWWVAIICNPGELRNPQSAESSFIITLDSLDSDPKPPKHSSTCKHLIEYLWKELSQKKEGKAVERSAMPAHTAENIPRQNNGWDCGVYLLSYIEALMKDPHGFTRAILDKQPALEVQANTMRAKIFHTIRELAEDGKADGLGRDLPSG